MTSTNPATHDWELWSTQGRLVVTDPTTMSQARALVEKELQEIEQAASRFRPDSELMTLVRGPDGSAELSPLLAELMEAALTAARESGGAVDPTLGSVLVSLGYDRDIEQVRRGSGGPATTPSPQGAAPTHGTPVTVVHRRQGWRALSLEGRRLTMPPGTQLDLGASAKAVAADRCARLVHDRLETGVMVSLGGDIATAGPAPEGGWQVVVQDLPSDVPQQITLQPGAAVATSSRAKRAWTQDGAHRHHLLDPATRLPAQGPWRSISVVAPTCLRANTATTAAMVKGDSALAWLRGTGLPARLVSRRGHLVTLGGWPREVVA